MADPRAGAQTQTPEDKLQQLGRAIYQYEQIVKSEKPGSPEFNKAAAALKKLREQFAAANKEVQTKRDAAKRTTAQKKLKALEEERLRKVALDEDTTDVDNKITAEKNKATATPPVTPKPGVKDSDGDGTPDAVDKTPTVANKPPVIVKPKPKPGDIVTPPPADGLDTKTLWVSYLRSTFASLEDKTQKAQIDKLLEDAKTFKYSEETFMEILKGTIWWQTTLPSMRSFFLETSDPRNASTFTEKVQNKMSTIAAKLDTLGISAMSTDPATGKLIDNSEFIKGLAMQTIQNNWDDAQLEDFLATKSTVMFTGGGTLGSTLEKVKNQAYMYGIKIDSALEKEINFSLLDPNDGRDGNYWLYSMKQQAMDSPTYKPFSESLKAGRSLYEVTNNYRQQMANLLEVDSTAITWDDLMGKVVDNTTGNARTFADFTKQVKQDKLWQYTKNAKETYSNMALDLARTFGYIG
jgi:hypothetical protein